MNGTPPPTRVRESAPLSPDRRGAPSSVLAGMAYDQHQAILRLEFRDGAVYQYFQVPRQTYRDLLQADSQGAYFNRYVRRVFPCARLHPEANSGAAQPAWPEADRGSAAAHGAAPRRRNTLANL